MAETFAHRWHDKPLAKLALWALSCITLFIVAPGAGWLVRSAIANEAADARQDAVNTRQDAQIVDIVNQAKEQRREILDELREIKADIKALRK